MASPTERADKVRPYLKGAATYNGKPLVPKGALLVTPEDIRAGWRVLTPEQAAEADRHKAALELIVSARNISARDGMKRIAAEALAGVPGKDSDT